MMQMVLGARWFGRDFLPLASSVAEGRGMSGIEDARHGIEGEGL